MPKILLGDLVKSSDWGTVFGILCEDQHHQRSCDARKVSIIGLFYLNAEYAR